MTGPSQPNLPSITKGVIKSVAISGSGYGLATTLNFAFKMWKGFELPTDTALFLAFCLTVGAARVWHILHQIVLKKWDIDIDG